MISSNSRIGLVTDTHVYFLDGIFSQWRYAAFHDPKSNENFSNAEQYMMYYKAVTMNDEDSVKEILAEPHPARVKKLGRAIKHFDESKWVAAREKVVYRGNYLKFTQNPEYLTIIRQLVGHHFVECSSADRIWGIGLDLSDARILNEENWLGLNLLGEILTRVAKDV